MRRPLLRAGVLPAVTALALLTGCGSSDDDGGSTAAGETTATGAPEATDGGFCAEAVSIQERLAGSATAAGDPGDLPEILRAAAREMRAIDAPDEIAPDWSALADDAEQLAATLQGVDLSDPEALATLEQELAPLEQELDTASTNVQAYLAEECGLGLPTEESAPTS
ncbi:hypothetical protein [Blastococcus sp. SYSU DS1021]